MQVEVQTTGEVCKTPHTQAQGARDPTHHSVEPFEEITPAVFKTKWRCHKGLQAEQHAWKPSNRALRLCIRGPVEVSNAVPGRAE